MRYAEVISSMLLEGRDAPLYHWMNDKKAQIVFRTDILRARFAHKIIGREKGISLTRNPRYVHHNGMAVCLVFDQVKLTQTHRIIPVDADWAAAFDRNAPAYTDRNGYSAHKGDEAAEEYVIGTIQPLHRYLSQIIVKNHNDEQFIDTMMIFARRYNIPVKVLQNPDYFWASYGQTDDDAA